MLIFALNFLLGIVIFSSKNTIQITPLEWLAFVVLILSIFYFAKRHKIITISASGLLLGFIWMGLFSTHVLNQRVAPNYLNKNIVTEGFIASVPQIFHNRTSFIFNVKKPFTGSVRLSWYGENRPILNVGEFWKLHIKIKQNNGLQNKAGFDYEKWLFYQQIDATGYVRNTLNQKLAQTSVYPIHQLRQTIRYKLDNYLQNLAFKGVINAVIIGDRSLISPSHWDLFKSTNTTHLSVVSGLHIGLISGFVFILSSWLWRRCARCCSMIPAQIIAAYFGIISAFLYALIAGFSVPTQRAFIMAATFFISLILRRHHNIWQLYAVALLLVLIINPISILSVGFWLSFYVVGIIIYGVGQHQDKSWLYRLIYIQLLITIATIPLIVWFFQQGSIFSPIANLVAIPVFSFIVVPISLIATIFTLTNLDYLANFSFIIADQALIYLSHFLALIKNIPFNQWHYGQTSTIHLLLLVLIAMIAITPKALKLRWFALLLVTLLLVAPNKKIDQGSVLINVFDVGQGLSILVQTQNHNLLFDTGAKFASGFNMGEAVINPYLYTHHINHLDKMIISHGDNDHIGGADSVLDNFNVSEIYTSTATHIKQPTRRCKAGQTWHWDEVVFEVLSPDNKLGLKGNNGSCVIKVSSKNYSFLMTADIEKEAEKYLIQKYKNKLQSDIMLSPHHGSHSSSTQSFINTVLPKIAIVSSGYKNRFNHPAQIIKDRYRKNNITLINTACAGQITISLADKLTINQHRKDGRRYYMRQCVNNS